MPRRCGPPPTRCVVLGQNVAGQGAEGGDAGAGGQQLQSTVTVVGDHGPPRRAWKATSSPGRSEARWRERGPWGTTRTSRSKTGSSLGADRMRRAPSIAEAVEVRLDAHEPAGVEAKRCAVDDLEADADRSRRGGGGHRCHRCPTAVAAVAEPPPLRDPSGARASSAVWRDWQRGTWPWKFPVRRPARASSRPGCVVVVEVMASFLVLRRPMS